VAEAINVFLLALVVLNVVAVVMETVDDVYLAHKVLFHYISGFSLLVFTIEYLLRIWSCDVDPNYRHPLLGRLKFGLTPLAFVDLMVILPSYLALAFPSDHTLLRSLRILWIFRLLKLHRYSESLQTIMDVVKARERELAMSFTAIIFFLILSSTLIFFLEHDAQPQNFPNIPATMCGGAYHDYCRHEFLSGNPLGKLIGGLIIILGWPPLPFPPPFSPPASWMNCRGAGRRPPKRWTRAKRAPDEMHA